MDEGNAAGALRDICGLVEGTARAEGRVGGRGAFKSWLDDNLDLVLQAGVPSLRTKILRIGYEHPDLPKNANGDSPTLAEIMYHVIRCSLFHEGTLPNDLEFVRDETIQGGGAGHKLVLPEAMVLGLILAVLASSANVDEQLPDSEMTLSVYGFPLHLNRFWGKKTALMQALSVLRLAALSR